VSEFRMFANRKPGLRLESAIFSFLPIFVHIFCELCGRYAAKVIMSIFASLPALASYLYQQFGPGASSRKGT
jgi:hypothetical protein